MISQLSNIWIINMSDDDSTTIITTHTQTLNLLKNSSKRRRKDISSNGQGERSRNSAGIEANTVAYKLVAGSGSGSEPDSGSKDDLLPQSSTFHDSTNESVSMESVISNSDLIQEAMNNHLILKEIFKHSLVKDLLQFSLVCKEWNLNSRTVLRENKICVAKIRKYDLCQDLKKLNTLLQHCVNAPFNGLALYNYSVGSDWMNHTCVKEASNNLMESFSSTLLVKIPFIKYLEMGWEDEKPCVAIPLLKRIFKNYAANLEGLSLFAIKETPVESLAGYFEIDKITTSSSTGSWLPKLKFLEILELDSTSYSSDNVRVSLVKQLILAAPNVIKLYGDISSKFLDFFCEENKLDAVKEFLFEPGQIYQGLDDLDDEEDDEEILDLNKLDRIKNDLELSLQFAQIHPKLVRLSISSEYMQEFISKNPGRAFGLLSDILTSILTSSCDHLEELEIHHLDLMLLTRLKIPPLTRLRHIELSYCPHLAWTLTKIDFSKLFPNLESVGLSANSGNIDANFYLTQDMVERMTHDAEEAYPWLRVTQLGYFFRDRFNRHITKIFPNIKHAIFTQCKYVGTACTALWAAWPEIESITLKGVSPQSIYKSRDSTFTGMSQRQCNQIWDAILDEVDYTDLLAKSQARSSIKDLTKLKIFRIELGRHRKCSSYNYKNPKSNDVVFLTAVTKTCVLEKMPQLTFEIVRETCCALSPCEKSPCRFSMEHLEPYVNLINPETCITRRRPRSQVFRN